VSAERGRGDERARLDVCARCGKAMRPGTVKYLVRIEVLADWDGHLVAIGDEEEQERAMRSALKAMEERDEAELLREVYHREVHLLCPGCRDRYMANPLNMPLPGALP
jgi:predicted amidophosphoribosyltransferase